MNICIQTKYLVKMITVTRISKIFKRLLTLQYY